MPKKVPGWIIIYTALAAVVGLVTAVLFFTSGVDYVARTAAPALASIPILILCRNSPPAFLAILFCRLIIDLGDVANAMIGYADWQSLALSAPMLILDVIAVSVLLVIVVKTRHGQNVT